MLSAPVISTSTNEWRNRRLGTSGVVMPNMDLIILDPSTGRIVENGGEGEVCYGAYKYYQDTLVYIHYI